MMTVRGLPTEGSAASLTITPNTRSDNASLPIVHDRHGDGWHAASLSIRGPRGGLVAHLSLHVGSLRALAVAATLTADWMHARETGKAGPCLCHAWRHGPMLPCPNESAADSTYCRTCWTPEDGTQPTMHDSPHAPEEIVRAIARVNGYPCECANTECRCDAGDCGCDTEAEPPDMIAEDEDIPAIDHEGDPAFNGAFNRW